MMPGRTGFSLPHKAPQLWRGLMLNGSKGRAVRITGVRRALYEKVIIDSARLSRNSLTELGSETLITRQVVRRQPLAGLTLDSDGVKWITRCPDSGISQTAEPVEKAACSPAVGLGSSPKERQTGETGALGTIWPVNRRPRSGGSGVFQQAGPFVAQPGSHPRKLGLHGSQHGRQAW